MTARHAQSDQSDQSGKSAQRAQANIETAISIPVLLAAALFCAGIVMATKANTVVYTATSMAAVAAADVPSGRGDLAAVAADRAWHGTTQHYSSLLEPDAHVDGCGSNGYTPGDVLTCTGRARLRLKESPVGVFWVLPDPVVTTTIRVQTSRYRSTCPAGIC